MTSDLYALLLAALIVAWTVAVLVGQLRSLYVTILHNAAWVLGLVVVGTGVMNYHPISADTWMLLTASIVLFNLAAAAGGAQPAQPATTVEGTAGQQFSCLVTKRTFAVLLVLFTAGVFLYLSSVASQFGLSVLLHDPASIRGSEINYMAAFPLYGKILFYLGPLCLILVLFPRLVDGLESIRGRWILACLLVVAQLATLQRTNLFVVAAWACGLLILRAVTRDGTANDAPRRWAVPLLLSVAAALLVFQVLAVALGKTGNNNPAVSAFVDEPLRSSPYLSLPFYASSGIPAFDQLTRSDDDSYPPPRVGARPVYGEYNPQTWGRATFAGPLKVVPTRRWEEVAPFTAVPEPTNVYTWLEPWYRDFRGPGVLIGSAAIGFILSRLASRSFRSPHTYLAAGLLLGFSGLATFINRYMSVMSVVLYGTIWILGRLWSARISRATSAPIIERTR